MLQRVQSILKGIVQRGPKNPHAPLLLQNRICLEVVGPDEHGEVVRKKYVERVGNVCLTYGLDRLTDLLQSGGDASNWMRYIGFGSSSQAAASDDAGILGTFGTGTIGGVTASLSNSGARTISYQGTWSDAGNARTIQEVALCQTDTYNASGGARTELTGASSIAKGVNDTVNVSYNVIAAPV